MSSSRSLFVHPIFLLLVGCSRVEGGGPSAENSTAATEAMASEPVLPRKVADIGKECTDTSQCQQMCYIPVRDLPTSGKVTGKCSGGMSHWGSDIIEVKDGQRYGQAMIAG